jgi:hypothetical protein
MDGHMDQDIVKRILRKTREFWGEGEEGKLGTGTKHRRSTKWRGRAKHGGIREVEN